MPSPAPETDVAADAETQAPQADTAAATGSAGSGGPDPAAIAPALEAVLLTADRPLQPQRLAEILRLVTPQDGGVEEEAGAEAASEGEASEPGAGGEGTEGGEEKGGKKGGKKKGRALGARSAPIVQIRRAVELLNGQYEQTGRVFRIEALAGGYRVMTLPAYAWAVAAYQGSKARTSLTHAAIESLAIIAYRQPMTRAQLEAIRGVACGEILRSLIERRLVSVVGRAEELGRPLLYGTTKHFLEVFGLSGLKDLPSVEELKNGLAGRRDEGGDSR